MNAETPDNTPLDSPEDDPSFVIPEIEEELKNSKNEGIKQSQKPKRTQKPRTPKIGDEDFDYDFSLGEEEEDEELEEEGTRNKNKAQPPSDPSDDQEDYEPKRKKPANSQKKSSNNNNAASKNTNKSSSASSSSSAVNKKKYEKGVWICLHKDENGNICFRDYKSKDVLAKHYERDHDGISFACPLGCQEAFYRTQFSAHFRNKHPQENTVNNAWYKFMPNSTREMKERVEFMHFKNWSAFEAHELYKKYENLENTKSSKAASSGKQRVLFYEFGDEKREVLAGGCTISQFAGTVAGLVAEGKWPQPPKNQKNAEVSNKGYGTIPVKQEKKSSSTDMLGNAALVLSMMSNFPESDDPSALTDVPKVENDDEEIELFSNSLGQIINMGERIVQKNNGKMEKRVIDQLNEIKLEVDKKRRRIE